jgi:Tol biopolymer transport system component
MMMKPISYYTFGMVTLIALAFFLAGPASGQANWLSPLGVNSPDRAAVTRVSVASDGTQANEISLNPSISADGRYVAFDSFASNLVIGDTNGVLDVFVHDRLTGWTQRVSVSSAGVQGNQSSHTPSISADGRYVAFQSEATNLVDGDTNGWFDIFVHDRHTGVTELVSMGRDGGRANGTSRYASISAEGRFVAFYSDADNLVSGDTNQQPDIFVRDRHRGVTELVSRASDGRQGNGMSESAAISADGRWRFILSPATW